MRLPDQLETALAACFDAVFDEALWPTALQVLGESLGAQSCTFASGNVLRDPVIFPRSSGHQEFAQLWIQNQSYAPDPHVERTRRLARLGRTFLFESDVSTDDQRRSDPYYQETARPGGRDWWAAVCFATLSGRYCLPLYRSQSRGPFSPAEARIAAGASEHLSRLVSLAEKMARSQDKAHLAPLDALGVAAMTVEADGSIGRMNVAADTLVGKYVCVSGRRLRAAYQVDEKVLQRLINVAACAPGEVTLSPPFDVLTGDGFPPLVAEVLPLGGSARAYFGGGRALLTFRPWRDAPVRNERLLRMAYPLTAAEARLVMVMQDGAANGELALRLGLSVETVRSQLRIVFQKMNCATRTEVVALVSRLLS